MANSLEMNLNHQLNNEQMFAYHAMNQQLIICLSVSGVSVYNAELMQR